MNKLVFIFSLVLNKAILHNRKHSLLYRVVAGDRELMYHWYYLVMCLLGWMVHEFLYSVLVRTFVSHGYVCTGTLQYMYACFLVEAVVDVL